MLALSEYPDKPPEAAGPEMRRKYEIHPRVSRKTSPDRPKRATIRRKKKMGSSLGLHLLPPCIRIPYKKETDTGL